MNNFEEKLKYISKNDFEVPESYEKSVNDALKYVSNMQTSTRRINKKKTDNKFIGLLQKVATIVLVGALSVTVYAGITGNISFEKMGLNKLSQNYEDNKVAINEKIDNEYFTLSLENIARDSAYVILEYKINLKEKALNEFNEITYNDNIGYTIGIGNSIEINGEKDPFYITHTEKESDTEYSYYQIVYTMMSDEDIMDLKIWLNYLWTEYYTNQTVQIDEVFEISSKIDNLEELDIKEQQQVLDDGSTLILDKVLNTNFQTFVRVRREINNISYEEYQNSNALQHKSFLITDENDNLIPYRTYTGDIIGKYYYLANTREEIDINKLYKLKKEDLINVEENYVVLLDNVKDVSKIKVIPIKSRLYNDRTNEEREMYNKATWYPVVEGDKIYSKQSDLGGTLEITNIKIDDENIIFNYNKKGIVENGTGYVLIRNKNMKMNYICSIKQDVTNSGEVIFGRDLAGAAGLEIRQGMLDNIEDLEFTLLFGKVTEFDGKPFETKMPEFSNQKLKIDNITRGKSYTKTVKCYINSNERNYVVEYDSNDNLLGFNGYTNDLYYKDGDKTERIFVKDYEKATDLVKAIEKILNYKNIEYTIE
ncbi:MAG: hypothetical protein J6J60_04095 [Clostridia bacterium]|nr:hypothetical protein [Clostridia bacterium]MBP3596564.1 hypothetical protein [Clostridia bacterium]